MPRLDDEEGSAGNANLLTQAQHRVASAWDGFIDFVFSDNVLEVAVGLIDIYDSIPHLPNPPKEKTHWRKPPHQSFANTLPPKSSIAAAFSRVVNSFVSDMLLPIISLIPGLGRNFDDLFAVLRRGDGGSSSSLSPGGLTVNEGESTWQSKGYNTVKQANDDGALVLAYGSFLDKIINFLIIGLSLYVIAQTYQSCSGDKVIKRTVKCKYCRKRISDKAKRCFNCTSWQDGREE